MSTMHCRCGAKLTLPAEVAHGTCDGCRVAAHKPVPKRNAPLPQEALFDEPEHTDRRQVPLDNWPDYRAAIEAEAEAEREADEPT